MTVEEQPHVVATCKDASWWLLAGDCYADFHAQWTNGALTWSGRNAYGERVTILLADITGVVEKTAESLATIKAEKEEARMKELLGKD